MLKGGIHSITFVRAVRILDGEFKPGRNDSECPSDWRVKDKPPLQVIRERLLAWLSEQSTLMEAFAVAVSFHVLMFPIIWFAGWALPWPKAPSVTTVIWLNIEDWPRSASPTKIESLYDVEKSKPLPKESN